MHDLHLTYFHFRFMVDSFTVPLHSPNGRQMPAIRAVQGDCQLPLQNGGNFQRTCEPTIYCRLRLCQHNISMNQSQKCVASPLKAMFHTPLAVPQPRTVLHQEGARRPMTPFWLSHHLSSWKGAAGSLWKYKHLFWRENKLPIFDKFVTRHRSKSEVLAGIPYGQILRASLLGLSSSLVWTV